MRQTVMQFITHKCIRPTIILASSSFYVLSSFVAITTLSWFVGPEPKLLVQSNKVFSSLRAISAVSQLTFPSSSIHEVYGLRDLAVVPHLE